MLDTLGFCVGDLCQIKEKVGHDSRIITDKGNDYIIIGFVISNNITYSLIYGTNYLGHNGVYEYSPLIDQNNNPIKIDRDIYPDLKFTFIEVTKITKSQDILKLTNLQIKRLIKC